MRNRYALAASCLGLLFTIAASAAEEKAPPQHQQGVGQMGMGCEHMKDMMMQMEKAPGMSMEQKAAAFDAHMKQMREMMGKMPDAKEHK